MKKIIIWLLMPVLLLSVLSGCKEVGTLTVLDTQGTGVENASYVQLVRQELEDILMESMNISRERAQQALQTQSFTVHTSYDSQVAKALSDACSQAVSGQNAGCAVTDLQGNLVATYSSADDTNYALRRGSPYGTLTPLSVYTPAFEDKLIHWGTGFEDSGYMLIDDGNGSVRMWPSPAGEDYTYQKFRAYQALRLPINTVTVRCLAHVGAAYSISFLQQRFGMQLTDELNDAAQNGDNAVLSDLVFGYLSMGVTPVDMAGYYQVFANGGSYEQPKAVQKLLDPEGNVLYERVRMPKPAITATTADLMNKLLQGVVANGGTGMAAAVKDVQVAGKTGSGSESNWFVGVTPGYSLAVWHGGTEGNRAAEVFSLAVEGIYADQPNANRNFITHAKLEELVLCSQSGMAVSPKCTSIEIGYFAETDVPDICDQH